MLFGSLCSTASPFASIAAFANLHRQTALCWKRRHVDFEAALAQCAASTSLRLLSCFLLDSRRAGAAG